MAEVVETEILELCMLDGLVPSFLDSGGLGASATWEDQIAVDPADLGSCALATRRHGFWSHHSHSRTAIVKAWESEPR